MTGVAHLKIDLDGFDGADSPPLGAWTRVLLDPIVSSEGVTYPQSSDTKADAADYDPRHDKN